MLFPVNNPFLISGLPKSFFLLSDASDWMIGACMLINKGAK